MLLGKPVAFSQCMLYRDNWFAHRSIESVHRRPGGPSLTDPFQLCYLRNCQIQIHRRSGDAILGATNWPLCPQILPHLFSSVYDKILIIWVKVWAVPASSENTLVCESWKFGVVGKRTSFKLDSWEFVFQLCYFLDVKLSAFHASLWGLPCATGMVSYLSPTSVVKSTNTQHT